MPHNTACAMPHRTTQRACMLYALCSALCLRPRRAQEALRCFLNCGGVALVAGSGTACIVSPVDGICYNGEDFAIPVDESDPSMRAGECARFSQQREEWFT